MKSRNRPANKLEARIQALCKRGWSFVASDDDALVWSLHAPPNRRFHCHCATLLLAVHVAESWESMP